MSTPTPKAPTPAVPARFSTFDLNAILLDQWKHAPLAIGDAHGNIHPVRRISMVENAGGAVVVVFHTEHQSV